MSDALISERSTIVESFLKRKPSKLSSVSTTVISLIKHISVKVANVHVLQRNENATLMFVKTIGLVPSTATFCVLRKNLMGIYMAAGQIAHAQPMHMGAGAPLDVPFADGQVGQVGVVGPVNVMGNMPDGRRASRKHAMTEDMVERTVERRQKRMIDNRESAARSRARKQAYTSELEIKATRLEEENEELWKRMVLEEKLDEAP